MPKAISLLSLPLLQSSFIGLVCRQHLRTDNGGEFTAFEEFLASKGIQRQPPTTNHHTLFSATEWCGWKEESYREGDGTLSLASCLSTSFLLGWSRSYFGPYSQPLSYEKRWWMVSLLMRSSQGVNPMFLTFVCLDVLHTCMCLLIRGGVWELNLKNSSFVVMLVVPKDFGFGILLWAI